MDYSALVAEIKKKQFRPIYFLMGEEPFFIDQISKLIEETALSEEERSFNQTVLYGSDVNTSQVISEAKRFKISKILNLCGRRRRGGDPPGGGARDGG